MTMTSAQASTKMLLHFDASNASDFVDSGPLRLKLYPTGGAGSTASSKFGSYCYENAGAEGVSAGIRIAQFPISPSGTVGDGPYLIEAWIYPYAYPTSIAWIVGYGYDSFNRPAMLITSAGRILLRQADVGNNIVALESSTSVPLNQWSHVQVSRDLFGVSRIHVDGVQVAIDPTLRNMSGSYDEQSILTNWGIGFDPYSGQKSFRGRIDEVRVVSNEVGFTPDFSTQTSAHPDSASGDSLLLHGDGANGASVITDSSANGLVASQAGPSGNVVTSTASSRFGGSSLRFGGLQALTYSPSSLFDVSARDFTLEFWVNFDVSGNSGGYLVQLFGASFNNRAFIYFDKPSRGFAIHTVDGSGTGADRMYLTMSQPGTWQHIAVVKSGGALMAFSNGKLSGVVSLSIFPTGPLGLSIGRDNFFASTSEYFQGYIDEFRFTAGIARYGSVGFTPRTAPFADCPKPEGVITRQYRRPGAGVPSVAPRLLSPSAKVRDLYHGGRGVISGTVKEKASPANLPLRRRVLLIRERDMQCVREVWSNAATGAYEFRNVDEHQTYTVLSYDHTHNYRATLADNLTPSLS